MNKTRTVSAVDIGSTKVTALIAQAAVDPVTFESKISIVGAASSQSKGVKKGQIVDIESTVESTISAVEAAERMAGYNLDAAFISVGGAHVASQNSTGVVAVSDARGEINPEDVGRVMEAARAISLPTSREIIHVLPRDFVVDGEGGIKDPIGMSGVRLEVETHIITGSTAALKNLTKTVSEVGIDVHEIVFSGIASAESVLTETEKELGCLLIDIGGGTTSVNAFIDGSTCYSSTIPIGSKNVTNDLAIGLRVTLESAEKIKLALSDKSKNKKEAEDQIDLTELGAEENKKVSKRTLVEGIIRPRLNEIFSMVRIDLERNGLINRIPSGAVVTGGGAMVIGVEESAKRTLSMPVRVGIPTGVSGLVDDIINPQYATAVGLVLYGAKKDFPQASVLPSFGKKFKLPAKGSISKLFETVKNLLP